MIKDFFLGDQPYPEIAFLKAFLFFHGYGVANDDRTAFASCSVAAEQGVCCAQYLLGVMCLSGRGTPPDVQKATEWFTKAADAGHAAAAGALSQICERTADSESAQRAFRWALRAAELGSAEYAASAALRYLEGRGVERNDKKAVEWFKKASDMGEPTAMRMLAHMHEKGIGGLSMDVTYARRLLKNAEETELLHQTMHFSFLRELALNGDRTAQKSLSAVYKNGWLGQSRSEARAGFWAAKAGEVLVEPE